MKQRTPFEQAVGFLLGLIAVIFVLGICINYNIENARSRDARQQYTEQSGCGWGGNEVTGYHLEC